MWKPDILKARDLAEKNQKTAKRLKAGFEDLNRQAKSVDARHNQTLQKHFDRELAPFAVLFARIKNVELEDLDLAESVPAIRAMTPETQSVSLGTVQGLVSVAGGAAAGAGAGAVTFAAVGAFATASTGAAISGLSGAAATSATLAWLGGGSLAAGGAGMAGGAVVLGAIVAVPAILAGGAFIWWKGQQELARQKQVRAKLREAEGSLKTQSALVRSLESTSRQMRATMKRLGRLIREHNDALAATLDDTDDYSRFSDEKKQALMIHVALVMAMTSVMSTQLMSGPRTVNKDVRRTLAEANAVADASTR